jgi:RNA polymerase sigma-70 factor (ECF subfamily)
MADSPSPRGTDSPDTALLRAVREGDAQAVDAWYRAEHPRVFRLCFGVLADSAEAEDAAQDAMLHLLDHLDRWDPHRPYRAWRAAVVVHLCRDRQRRVATRLRHATRASAERLPPVLPDPSEEALRAEVRATLARALAHLPPREREAFVLRELEGASTEEAAEVLGVTESTVRSLVTLARRRLRNLLDERLLGAAGGPGDLEGQGRG